MTAADREADQMLRAGLEALPGGPPVVSEESAIPAHSERKNWERFWLVDPLDGTKEFLAGNGEFTVNVALIEGGEPTLGVVYAPALDVLYFSGKGHGAWKQQGGRPPVRISSPPPSDLRAPVRIVESRSHPSPELERFLGGLKIKERIKMGSSLKFCLVAEGRADVYPRLGPAMEWDTAAGDCIYRDSAPEGRHETGLLYNQPSMRHDGFVIGAKAGR